jgi:hypothetical protein
MIVRIALVPRSSCTHVHIGFSIRVVGRWPAADGSIASRVAPGLAALLLLAKVMLLLLLLLFLRIARETRATALFHGAGCFVSLLMGNITLTMIAAIALSLTAEVQLVVRALQPLRIELRRRLSTRLCAIRLRHGRCMLIRLMLVSLMAILFLHGGRRQRCGALLLLLRLFPASRLFWLRRPLRRFPLLLHAAFARRRCCLLVALLPRSVLLRELLLRTMLVRCIPLTMRMQRRSMLSWRCSWLDVRYCCCRRGCCCALLPPHCLDGQIVRRHIEPLPSHALCMALKGADDTQETPKTEQRTRG